jgi:excisionase family DNA binding protein
MKPATTETYFVDRDVTISCADTGTGTVNPGDVLVGREAYMNGARSSSVMSLNQAATYLQISKAHLSNVINGKVSGVKPVRFFRMGRRILIKREWIDEWLNSAAPEAARQ